MGSYYLYGIGSVKAYTYRTYMVWAMYKFGFRMTRTNRECITFVLFAPALGALRVGVGLRCTGYVVL